MNRRVVATNDLGELWLALVADGVVADLAILPSSRHRMLGAIAKGRITRLAPGVRAAFVQVGMGRDVFTVLPPGTVEERGLKEGDEVLVQITREPHGDKGHRATFEISLPGWALVLSPGSSHRGVSRRIADPLERDRLRALVDEIAPAGFGLIARTAAVGASRDELAAERDALLVRWRRIETVAAESHAPVLLHREENEAGAFVRDQLGGGLDEVVLDPGIVPAVAAALDGLAAGARPVLRRHEGPLPAVEAYGLERALAQALAAEVPLAGGGRLVVQTTEALVAIDVNSGRDTGAADLEQTALRTNLEAVPEIARQVRLRGLGGLIVVDFIDVERAESRARVNQALAEAFAPDRMKSRVLPLSDFCVAQITRQRRGLPLERLFLEPCPDCRRGLQPRPAAEARRLLRDARRRLRPLPAGRVLIHARAETIAEGRGILDEWGAKAGLPVERIAWAPGPPSVDVL